MNSRDIVVDGVRAKIHDSEPQGSREAVVFVHGNPGAMEDYESLIPEVSRFARVVALDLPGYGRASRPWKFDYTVPGYARFIAGVLDQIGVERVHLVLHDFGGPFGLAWAAAHPKRFASATLINTGVLLGYTWHKLAKIWQKPVVGEVFQLITTARVLKMALDRENPKPFPQDFVDRIVKYSDLGQKRAVLKLYRASRDTETAGRALHDVLGPLDRPACVIWGAEDPYIPVALADAQRATFPRAEVHVLPGRGHWPFVDDPEAVKALAVPFLRRQIESIRANGASASAE